MRVGWALSWYLAAAVRVELADHRVPPKHSIATLNHFYLYAKPSAKGNDTYIPGYGWGLWDSPYPRPAKVLFSSVRFRPDPGNAALAGPGMWLTVIGAQDFWEEFYPYQKKHHFCCSDADVEAGACAAAHQLLVPKSLRDRVSSAPIAVWDTKGLATEAIFPLQETGSYYLLLVKCSDNEVQGRLEGHATIVGSHGFMSGLDVPKLHLYFSTSLFWAILSTWWLIATYHHQDSLHFIHNFLALTNCISLAESLGLYVLWSWDNDSATAAPALAKLVVIVLSVLRAATVCQLLMMLCLGLYSTTPVLAPHQKMRILLLLIAFGICDFIRLLAMRFHLILDISGALIVTCSVPLVALALGGGAWAWRSLMNNIRVVREQGNHSKEVLLCKLRRVLTFCVFCFTLSVGLQFINYFLERKNGWKYEWIYTDALPAYLFIFVQVCVAVICRPSLQTKQDLYLSNEMQTNFYTNMPPDTISSRPGSLPHWQAGSPTRSF